VTELRAPAATTHNEGAQLDALPGLGLIVAVGRGGAIGRAGGLPWHAPEDLRHFRLTTTGHAVILGATTWHSINRALPDRQLIVITSRELTVPEGVLLASDPESALAVALAIDESPLVAGGSRVYEALLPSVVRVHLTDIDTEVHEADAFFSPLDPHDWTERRAWRGEDERLTFRILDRVPRADGPIGA
jgi:dihydrofolate reductase